MPGEADNVQTENVTGGNAADRLTGNSQANRLNGGPGADVLIGLDGNDRLLANDGVADTTLDSASGSNAGTADSAALDLLDPVPLGCEAVTQEEENLSTELALSLPESALCSLPASPAST